MLNMSYTRSTWHITNIYHVLFAREILWNFTGIWIPSMARYILRLFTSDVSLLKVDIGPMTSSDIVYHFMVALI